MLIRGAVRSQSGTSFIGQDGGWFRPLQESYMGAESFPQQDLLIVAVQRMVQREPVLRVTLLLDRTPSRRLGIWIYGAFTSGFALLGSQLVFDVPVAAQGPHIEIGMAAADVENRYGIALTIGGGRCGGVSAVGAAGTRVLKG